MSASDRQHHIEALLTRYRHLLEERWPQGPVTIDQIEELVEEIHRQLERETEERILEDQQPPRENRAACPDCGAHARYRATVPRQVIARHGEYTLSRPYYYCPACGQGFAPLDRQLGLDAGATTPGVRLLIADAASREPFAAAAELLARYTALRVSATTVETVTVTMGTALGQAQRAAAQRHQAGFPPPVRHKPRRLYVSIDGLMLPLRDAWKRDQSLGKLVCRWGECKIGCVYEARPGAAGDEGVLRTAYVATLGDVTQFTPLIATLAHEYGHHFAQELIVLGDGALWIWKLAARQFPTAIEIVDFYHAAQHLAKVAAAQFGAETAAATAWVEARTRELYADQVGRVLAAIAAWQPEGEEERKLRETEYQFFHQNAERMRYGTFVKKGYHIGSGVVESACRHVIGRRLDEAGMHWREPAAEAIAGLRAALRSTHPPDLRPYATMAA